MRAFVNQLSYKKPSNISYRWTVCVQYVFCCEWWDLTIDWTPCHILDKREVFRRCECTCVFSCHFFDETACHNIRRETGAYPNVWAYEWRGSMIVWTFYYIVYTNTTLRWYVSWHVVPGSHYARTFSRTPDTRRDSCLSVYAWHDMNLKSVGCGEAFVAFHTLVRRILGYFSLDAWEIWLFLWFLVYTAERRFFEVVQEVRSSRAWPAVHRNGKGRKKVR